MKLNQPPTGAAVVEQAINEIHTTRPAKNASAYSALRRFGTAMIAAPLLVGVASAADVASTNSAPAGSSQPQLTKSSDSWEKPAWLTDLSLGVKETYDDNVFLSGADKQFLPANFKVPAGSVAALENKSSWVTTVSPKIGVNFAPLLGDQKTLQVLGLAYAPEFAVYHDTTSESYNAHRFAATVKAKADALSLNIDQAFNYIDGNQFGAVYPGGFNSAYATGTIRERRDQYQDRGTITLQYDQDKWFARPTATLLYYDLNTVQTNGFPGYQNYADRYDVNGGGDLGYKFLPKLAGTVGYRYGHQYQQQYSKAVDPLGLSSSSDYQRVLFGVEGKPWKWLDLKLQAGPDFRHYGPHADVGDHNTVKYYADATIGVTITPEDSLSFKYKQWQWVSSTGRVPYFDSTYDLSYRRKLTDQLSLDLGGKVLQSDYTSGLNPGTTSPNPRNDLEYIVTAGLTYAFNSHISVNLNYELNLGRNAQDGIVNASTREFDRNLVSLGALFKF